MEKQPPQPTPVKSVTLSMDKDGVFKVDGNIATVEVLGFLEYAKAILLRDALPVSPAQKPEPMTTEDISNYALGKDTRVKPEPEPLSEKELANYQAFIKGSPTTTMKVMDDSQDEFSDPEKNDSDSESEHF